MSAHDTRQWYRVTIRPKHTPGKEYVTRSLILPASVGLAKDPRNLQIIKRGVARTVYTQWCNTNEGRLNNDGIAFTYDELTIDDPD